MFFFLSIYLFIYSIFLKHFKEKAAAKSGIFGNDNHININHV